jgi:CDP-diacylglycerol---serine O-phosphatidyltransferase
MNDEKVTPRQWASEHLEGLKDLSVSKVAPSALTLLGLCSGATAIPLAIGEEWKAAIVALFFAMFFDMLDGRAARWLGADSSFGGHLDSLADLVSFGVAPAVVAYSWSLWQWGYTGWIAALIFCACSAIRLARFNVQTVRDEGATQHFPYFTGLPTPAAACLMLLPLLVSFEAPVAFARNPLFYVLVIAFTSSLMVSRVPTPSLKYTKLRRGAWIGIAALAIMAVPMAIYVPWASVIAGLCIYLATIPLVIYRLHVARDAESLAHAADNEL